VHSGSENVVRWGKDNLYVIKSLREFQYIDDDGEDQGANSIFIQPFPSNRQFVLKPKTSLLFSKTMNVSAKNEQIGATCKVA
jgi:hypothetical protein